MDEASDIHTCPAGGEVWQVLVIGDESIYLPADVDIPFMLQALVGNCISGYEDVLRIKRAACLLVHYHYAERGVYLPDACCDEAVWVPA